MLKVGIVLNEANGVYSRLGLYFCEEFGRVFLEVILAIAVHACKLLPCHLVIPKNYLRDCIHDQVLPPSEFIKQSLKVGIN